jgi:hypothetical protein
MGKGLRLKPHTAQGNWRYHAPIKHTCMQRTAHNRTCANVSKHTNMGKYASIHTHTYTHTHECTHMHTHTLTHRPHVPYRNSMMTMVLKDSLGGNCRTVMVANISPDPSQLDESISTCRFAMRVALVRNSVGCGRVCVCVFVGVCVVYVNMWCVKCTSQYICVCVVYVNMWCVHALFTSEPTLTVLCATLCNLQ